MDKNNVLIESLQNCVTACEQCADACLDENNVESMVDCIRLDRNCADICNTTARLLSRNSDVHIALIELCQDICENAPPNVKTILMSTANVAPRRAGDAKNSAVSI